MTMIKVKSIYKKLFALLFLSLVSYPCCSQLINTSPLRTFEELGGVTWAQFSPDGKNFVTSGEKGFILWDTQSGNLIRSFEGHVSPIITAVFSQNGEKLLTGCRDDNTAILWETVTGRILARLKTKRDLVYSVRFSPDESMIVTACKDSYIELWDVQSQERLNSFSLYDEPSLGPRISVDFTLDGKNLIAGNTILDLNTGEILKTYPVSFRSFSMNDNYLLTRYLWDTTMLMDLETGEIIQEFKGHFSTGPFGGGNSALSQDGQKVVTYGYLDAEYRMGTKLWDVKTGRLINTFVNQRFDDFSFPFSKDSRYLLLINIEDNTLQLWDILYASKVRYYQAFQ